MHSRQFKSRFRCKHVQNCVIFVWNNKWIIVQLCICIGVTSLQANLLQAHFGPRSEGIERGLSFTTSQHTLLIGVDCSKGVPSQYAQWACYHTEYIIQITFLSLVCYIYFNITCTFCYIRTVGPIKTNVLAFFYDCTQSIYQDWKNKGNNTCILLITSLALFALKVFYGYLGLFVGFWASTQQCQVIL